MSGKDSYKTNLGSQIQFSMMMVELNYQNFLKRPFQLIEIHEHKTPKFQKVLKILFWENGF